jgi:hypothetical protein
MSMTVLRRPLSNQDERAETRSGIRVMTDAETSAVGPHCQRSLALILAATTVAVVFVAAAGVLLALRDFHNSDNSADTRTHHKYQVQYERCVESGQAATSCNSEASDACVEDPHWNNDTSLISSYCLEFGRS